MGVELQNKADSQAGAAAGVQEACSSGGVMKAALVTLSGTETTETF